MASIRRSVRLAANAALGRVGYAIQPLAGSGGVRPDEATRAVIERVRPYTMTSPERLTAVCDAVAFVVEEGIPGAIVECGVWRGGSMMAAALTLQRLGATDRDLHLFDTFSGMTAPTDLDVDANGVPAAERLAGGEEIVIAAASVDDVRRNLASTGYPAERLHFVVGPVEETVPAAAPERIALLRLDTDWYESTRHELVHLYPRLSRRGLLIIDDYGDWQGARRAVDEFRQGLDERFFLGRIDSTGRLAQKP